MHACSLRFVVGFGSGKFALRARDLAGLSGGSPRKAAPSPSHRFAIPGSAAGLNPGAAPLGRQKKSNSLQNPLDGLQLSAGPWPGQVGTTAAPAAGVGWVAGRSIPGGLPGAGSGRAKAGVAMGCCPPFPTPSSPMVILTCVPKIVAWTRDVHQRRCPSETPSRCALCEVVKGSGLGRSAGHLWSPHLRRFLHGPSLVWQAGCRRELPAGGYSCGRVKPAVKRVVRGQETRRQRAGSAAGSRVRGAGWDGTARGCLPHTRMPTCSFVITRNLLV